MEFRAEPYCFYCDDGKFVLYVSDVTRLYAVIGPKQKPKLPVPKWWLFLKS